MYFHVVQKTPRTILKILFSVDTTNTIQYFQSTANNFHPQTESKIQNRDIRYIFVIKHRNTLF